MLPGDEPATRDGLNRSTIPPRSFELAAEADDESETVDEWWLPIEEGVGPAGTYCAGLPAARRSVLREACRARLGPGPIVLDSVAWACRGQA